MRFDVVGLGNALMDALVVVEGEDLLHELGLVRGTMHPVNNARWMEVYERVKTFGVTLDSGGSCSNTVATVGRLGGRALFCGQVGEDTLGRQYASLLQAACGEHALQFARGQATGKCLSIISAKDAERTMLTDLGAAITLPDLGTFGSHLASARVAHFSGYELLDSPMKRAALEGIRVASEGGALVSLDAADPFVVEALRGLLWELLGTYVDVLFVNAEEALRLTGMYPEEAARHIAKEANVDTVVVKRGGEGSFVVHGKHAYAVSAVPVKAVDTTGAGDSYAGGFLYGLARGWDAARCGRLASSVAALAVAQVGAVVKDARRLGEAVERSAEAAA